MIMKTETLKIGSLYKLINKKHKDDSFLIMILCEELGNLEKSHRLRDIMKIENHIGYSILKVAENQIVWIEKEFFDMALLKAFDVLELIDDS